MTHVLLVELAFQRQEELATRARARARRPGRIASATSPTRRTRRYGSALLGDRLT
jgi:hypothetical protein